jgi:subtilisin family serine protease
VSRSIFSASQVLIKVAPDACTRAIQSVLARSGLGLRLSRQVAPGVFSVEFSQTDLDSVPRALDALRPYVLHAEADGVGFGAGSPPSDPFFPQQWNLTKTKPSEVDIGAGSFWDAVPSGAGVTIAVLDTGVDYTHPDLSALERRGFDFVNNDGDPFDDNGHGTGVAGVIFAARNNGFGTAGILPGARLLAVKVLDDRNLGYDRELIAGLAYARSNGASVVNLSLVGYPSNSLVRDELALCEASNMLVCVSAGNNGTDNDQMPDYPSSYTNYNIISVGGHDKTGARWSVATNRPSNFGVNSVDVFAPGIEIPSSDIPRPLRPSFATNISIWTGTSFAAPHVAAVASALRVLRTNWTAFQIKSVILSSAATNSALASLCTSGGRLDAAAAVSVTAPAPTPTPTPTSPPAPPPPVQVQPQPAVPAPAVSPRGKQSKAKAKPKAKAKSKPKAKPKGKPKKR